MITEVGIAGSGIMGSAIATINLQAGYDVVIFDLEESQLLKAKGRLDKIINEFNLSAAVKYADNISSMKDCNLIIECLTEDENIKSNFYKSIEENCHKKSRKIFWEY